MNDHDVDDAYLVARAQDGYLDAFEILVQRHGDQAYLLAFRLLNDREAARDVTQDALIAAWRALPRFRRNSEFRTWLYRIVTNKSLSYLARHASARSATEPMIEVSDPAPGPADSTLDRARTAAIQRAIAALPPPQRVPLILHEYQRLTYEQIAEITSSTIPAVRSQLFRARRALKSTLEEWR